MGFPTLAFALSTLLTAPYAGAQVALAPAKPGQPARLEAPGLAGAPWFIAAESGGATWPLAAGRLDAAGRARLSSALFGSSARVPSGATLHGLVAGPGGTSGFSWSPSGAPQGQYFEQPLGDPWDWNWGWGGVAETAGAIVSNTQPWQWFASLSAVNADATHPDAAVLVERNGGGGELYLAVADSVRSGVGVGPEPAGGVLVFNFPGPSHVNAVSFADVAGAGGEIRSYKGRTLHATVPIPDLGGSGTWTVYSSHFDITRLEIELVGPGLVGDVLLFPHTLRLNFDTTTTGAPQGWQAGGTPVQGYPGIGLYGGIQAVNAAPGHPDLALLFDSAAPTGGDWDLAAPGYGPDNDTPEGLVLIIAENDTDGSGDGLVDDPDDEADGGRLTFSFITSNTIFVGVTVIDLDDGGGSFVRVYDELSGQPIDFPLRDAGDNGVTVFDTPTGIETRNIEVHLQGSGALAELRLRQPS